MAPHPPTDLVLTVMAGPVPATRARTVGGRITP
jgi:hypothetical protein